MALLLSAVSGSLCAAFAGSLALATELRLNHPGLVFTAPVLGILSVAFYRYRADQCARGNDLVLERINRQNGEVPLRMAPLIFASSTASHLCGASVGREGAAVQIASGVAALLQRLFHLPPTYQRPLLQAGIAAGFGAIFGTPLAAAIFAIEVPNPKRWRFRMLPLCLLAAFVGDAACRAWGTHHSIYPSPSLTWANALDPTFLAAVLATGIGGGWLALLYLGVADRLRALFQKPPRWWLPPLCVGAMLPVLAQFETASDYLGLGVWANRPGALTLSTAFVGDGAHPLSWLWKLILTAVCISSGFKGGEVTPLFFIGATFGNALATTLALDPSTFAALGFVTVFSAASHTPATGILLGAELFGIGSSPFFALVCLIANHSGRGQTLFPSQEKNQP